MKIAHYGTGNVEDPLGVLHNENGKPIFQNNERFIAKENVKRCWAVMLHQGTWSMFRAKPSFDDAGESIVYRTSQRLICIRTPQPWKHAKRGIFSFAEPYIFWAREWKRLGRKECFALPIEEIVGYKQDRWGISLYVLTWVRGNENRYMVEIATNKTTINRLMGDLLTHGKIKHINELRAG